MRSKDLTMIRVCVRACTRVTKLVNVVVEKWWLWVAVLKNMLRRVAGGGRCVVEVLNVCVVCLCVNVSPSERAVPAFMLLSCSFSLCAAF